MVDSKYVTSKHNFMLGDPKYQGRCQRSVSFAYKHINKTLIALITQALEVLVLDRSAKEHDICRLFERPYGYVSSCASSEYTGGLLLHGKSYILLPALIFMLHGLKMTSAVLFIK